MARKKRAAQSSNRPARRLADEGAGQGRTRLRATVPLYYTRVRQGLGWAECSRRRRGGGSSWWRASWSVVTGLRPEDRPHIAPLFSVPHHPTDTERRGEGPRRRARPRARSLDHSDSAARPGPRSTPGLLRRLKAARHTAETALSGTHGTYGSRHRRRRGYRHGRQRAAGTT